MVLIRLKRLLNWCRDVKEIITKVPKMKGIKIHPKRPSYLTESDFAEIMKLHWLKPFYKEVFLMYSETGMRLREVFNGKLEGSWLVLMPDDNKTGITHEIPLKQHHIPVIREMKNRNIPFKTVFTGQHRELYEDVKDLVAGQRGRGVFEVGDLEAGIWSAGISVARVKDVLTCEELVSRIVSDAEAIINGRLQEVKVS